MVSELELGLLNQRSSRSTATSGLSARDSEETTISSLESQGAIFIIGMALFTGGYLSEVIGEVFLHDPADESTKRDPGDFTSLMWAAISLPSCGL
jgi:hypothetical protein